MESKQKEIKMMQELECTNNTDENGVPTGGRVKATGIGIIWQNGPLGRGTNRQEPNGAFVEGVIEAAKQRIQWYNDNGFSCQENVDAVGHLKQALMHLNDRTNRRETAGVEGTHERDGENDGQTVAAKEGEVNNPNPTPQEGTGDTVETGPVGGEGRGEANPTPQEGAYPEPQQG